MRLTDEQTAVLLKGIAKHRVQDRDGMSYVETWDIRAMMNRVFGFCGWSLISTNPTRLVFERETTVGKDKKPGYRVAYMAELELIVHTPDGDARYAGTSIGEAVMPDYKVGDAHDMAAKSAESGALKRAATNLGDQFGLSLYRGSLDPVVRRIVGFDPDKATSHEHDDGPGVGATPEEHTEIASTDEPDRPGPEDAGAGGVPPTPPAPPSTEIVADDDPVLSPIDEALGPDPGRAPRPSGESAADGQARRNAAVQDALKGMSNKDKIKVNATCRGEGIHGWEKAATEEQIDRVLNVINKIARGET